MVTEKTYKALKVLESTNPIKTMAANTFAVLMWGGDEDKKYLFTAVSNSGNGAAAGKKAWLCAGSYLGKLEKKKLVRWQPRVLGACCAGYTITQAGRNEIREYERTHGEGQGEGVGTPA